MTWSLFFRAVIQRLPVTDSHQTVPFTNTSLCLHLNVMALNDAFILQDSYKYCWQYGSYEAWLCQINVIEFSVRNDKKYSIFQAHKGKPKTSHNYYKNIYLKYSYKFETLAPSKVLPLWLDAVIPVLVPLLETLSKIFKGMLSRAASDYHWPSATSANTSFSNSNSSRGGEAAKSKFGRAGWVGHNHHFVCSQNRGIFLMLQQFNKNCWRPLTAFPLKILDNVSSSGTMLGSLHPVIGGGIRGGPKFQTCTNILNKQF